LWSAFPIPTAAFWIGMLLPKKTPRPIVEKLYQETLKATQTVELQAKLKTLGGEPMAMTPADSTRSSAASRATTQSWSGRSASSRTKANDGEPAGSP
jgi:tripartite-type tricarboxylate transporter receptor subunit TctC